MECQFKTLTWEKAVKHKILADKFFCSNESTKSCFYRYSKTLKYTTMSFHLILIKTLDIQSMKHEFCFQYFKILQLFYKLSETKTDRKPVNKYYTAFLHSKTVQFKSLFFTSRFLVNHWKYSRDKLISYRLTTYHLLDHLRWLVISIISSRFN